MRNHRYREANKGTHIGSQSSVAAQHKDHVELTRERRHDLNDPRVLGASDALNRHQKRHLVFRGERLERVGHAIEAHRPLSLEQLTLPSQFAAGVGNALRHLLAARAGDGAGGQGSLVEGLWAEGVAVGKGCLLARDGTHADALIDREAARLHDAFVEAPGL